MSSNEPDLFYVRHVDPEEAEKNSEPVPGTSSKTTSLDDVLAKIEAEREVMLKAIGKTITKKQFSNGVWDEKEKVVRITKQKSFNQYQPKGNCLTAFEALFYLECRSLVVEYNGISLTIQDGYRILLNGRDDQRAYVVFGVLSRLGYYVERLEKKLPSEQQEPETEVAHKKLKIDEGSVVLEEENHNDVINIRPLTYNRMRKLNRFDRKLFSDTNHLNEESSESIIYDVQQSMSAVPLTNELTSLYEDSVVKPLLSIGEIPTCEDLYAKLQAAGPQEYSVSNHDKTIHVDFHVYKNRKASKGGDHLFDVIICEPYDDIPSVKNIPNSSCPILYCMINDALEYGFFKVENTKLDERIPILWRAMALEL